MIITSQQLAEFLNKANRHTYAADSGKVESTRLGSKDLEYKEGNLTYHDTYFGGRDFIGEEIVYENDQPVWGMNYYGYILGTKFTPQQVYDFLKKALLQESKDILPVRGPKTFEEGNLEYINSVEGTLENFTGKEEIFFNGEVVYECLYHGGSVSA